MAEKLNINRDDIPAFLEDYGDIFLSLAYYRQCLDQVVPSVTNFIQSMDEIRTSQQLSNNKNLIKTCRWMEITFNKLVLAITGRFESFDLSSKYLWDNLSAERFRKVELLIHKHHTTLGEVLCVLSIKMTAWNNLFPDNAVGGPIKRSEFIMSEMLHGFDKIQKIEDSVPILSELNKTVMPTIDSADDTSQEPDLDPIG